jgi:cysteine desulfurase
MKQRLDWINLQFIIWNKQGIFLVFSLLFISELKCGIIFFRGDSMVYLDYSATTPVSRHVLDMDRAFHQSVYANPNSIHKLGLEALEQTNQTTSLIQNILNVPNHDVVYTSGATESNNLAIKGVCLKHASMGKHIITTPFEHGSITATLNYLSQKGFVVDVVEMDENGLVDLKDLESLITENTILVTIGLVNSELGIVQDLNAIHHLLSKYPKIIFHSDMTQAIGKIQLDFQLADLISLSAHKIYGFKGIGALLIKKGLSLTPVIHGGKSLSPLRGGTPPIGLIHSMGVALKDSYLNLNENRNMIDHLKSYLIKKLAELDDVIMNSNQYSLPHIVNISFLKGLSIDVQKYLSDHDIFVSTTSACSSGLSMSRVVMTLTNDENRARSSLRISLSHLTTESEIDDLIKCLEAYDESC